MLRPKRFRWAAMLAVTYFTVNYLLLALCGDFLYSYLPGLCGAFFFLRPSGGVLKVPLIQQVHHHFWDLEIWEDSKTLVSARVAVEKKPNRKCLTFTAGGTVAQEVTLSPAFSVTPMHRVAVLCYVLQCLANW